MRKRSEYLIILAMLAVLVLSAIVTFRPITRNLEPIYPKGDFSPRGYTCSLILFLLPLVSFKIWFICNRHRYPQRWSAYWMAAAVTVVIWSLLDILLGNTFFHWPNRASTLGIDAWGYTPGRGWSRSIPVEEFAFYIFGPLTILITYLWASLYWLAPFSAPRETYQEVARSRRLLHFQLAPLLGGASLFAAALLYRKLVLGNPPGFPGYLLFLVLLVVVPTVFLYNAIGDLVNLRALLFTLQFLLLVCLLWEATLALPYGWWGYRREQMLGIYIAPWFDLPIEEPLLWIAATWTNVIVYETLVLWQFSRAASSPSARARS